MERFLFVDVTTSRLQGHELGCSPAGCERKDTVGQPLLTIGLERGGEGVIPSTALNQIPIGSEQMRIRHVLEGAIQASLHLQPSEAG
jgi:hypothetical protein